MNISEEATLELLAAKLAPLVARELAKQSSAPVDQLLDVVALATRLGVSVRQVRRFDATGKIPQPLRIGRALRWRPEEITDWQREGMPDRKRWEAIKAAAKRPPTNFGGHGR